MSDDTQYCRQYGFDARWRQKQLEFLALPACDGELAGVLRRKVLTPAVSTQIIDAFFAKLQTHEQSHHLLESFDLARLKEKQTQYLYTFGQDFCEEPYFEQRLRVGIAHARVGVPLSLYLTAYNLLQTLILEEVSRADLKPAQGRALAAFVLKITALDIALATEVYHRAEVQHLESSVQRMRGQQRRLLEAMRIDELTGLLNRATVLTQLKRLLVEAHKTNQPLCVVMADLDYFKKINDEYGHQMGDEVLRDVAARMKSAVRDFDYVGRYGGEEFLVILENTSLHTAQQVAERVRLRVANSPIHLRTTAVNITISQGLAQAQEEDTPEALIERADQALYDAKQSGRNCVVSG